MKLKSRKIFDPIRKKVCDALPEEIVRQKLISHMISNLGFPKSLISIEKEIDALPHLTVRNETMRRADIICYSKGKESLFPLIMIECKAFRFNQKAIDQVLGYNEHVRASFIGIADEARVHVYWQEETGLKTIDFLPSFEELQRSVHV